MPAPDAPLLAPLLGLPDEPAARGWDRASHVLFAVLLVVVLAVFRDYGVTWDEWPHIGYGEAVARFYSSGFADQDAFTFRTNYFYGGGYDLLAAVVRFFAAPMEHWRAFHLLDCLVGVLGVLGTWKLARRLAGPLAGFVAALFLVVNPVWFGHMFNNPKDLPFAVAHVWSLYYLVDLIAAFPRPPRRAWQKLAVAVGLAMSVRIAGLLLLCYLGLAIALYAGRQGALRRSLAAAWAYLERLGLRAAGVAAGAWTIMLLAWPWALADPLRRPFVTLTRMSQYNFHKRRMPFAGEDIWNLDIGWNYLPHYFGYQLPEVVLALFLLGSVYAAVLVYRRLREPRLLLPAIALLILGVSIWFPPLYSVVKGSVLYDAYRHFLFLVPPLTALAALALTRVHAGLTRRLGRTATAVTIGSLALVGGDLARTMIRLHPHEYVYFNRLLGGPAAAVDRYDTDYYGNSFKEAAEGLAEFVWRSDPAAYLDTVYTYSGCISEYTASHYLPPNFRHATRREPADFYMGYTRGHCDRKHKDAPVIFAVERLGARLNVVKDLRAQPSKRRPAAIKPDTPRTESAINPRPRPKPRAEMGPALPPELAAERAAARRAAATGVYGPPLPPDLAAARAAHEGTPPP